MSFSRYHSNGLNASESRVLVEATQAGMSPPERVITAVRVQTALSSFLTPLRCAAVCMYQPLTQGETSGTPILGNFVVYTWYIIWNPDHLTKNIDIHLYTWYIHLYT